MEAGPVTDITAPTLSHSVHLDTFLKLHTQEFTVVTSFVKSNYRASHRFEESALFWTVCPDVHTYSHEPP